jgi:hypothetical protein
MDVMREVNGRSVSRQAIWTVSGWDFRPPPTA